jgi:hypothetical protein
MDMLLSLFEYCNTMIFASSIPSLHTVTPLFTGSHVHCLHEGMTYLSATSLASVP